ncbi:AraC family transcriptional regulator [Nocardiopsis ganjiahuensis]|uniref:AraC family transcriptional regulator n=1 Tax=Nocardiopsis ganjiahuensis TaxID=239984 RepID=UPI0005950A48|nr:AraC family transcriptional regulator [Nocardiopsis ganjiahuensis]
MVTDRLSEVLDLVEVRGVLSGGIAVRGRWVSRAEVRIPLKFVAVVCGRARLDTDGITAPISLGPGDVVILNDRSWLEIEGGSGDGARHEITPEEDFSSARLIAADREADDVIVGGRIELTPVGRALLLNVLPPAALVRTSAADSAPLRGSLHRLLDEVTEGRAGSAFAIRQHGQLLLLEVLRAYADSSELPAGWLGVLQDERLRPALDLMHEHPEQPWGLHDLARAAAMSRTSFAQRFRKAAGEPPLTYLSRWRMLLARRALRDSNARVSALASELGYASEGAFSTAFKRVVGESPLRYRQRVRAHPRNRPGNSA